MLKKTKPIVEGQVGPFPAARAHRPCFQPPRADGSLSCLRHTAAGGFANIRLKTDHNGTRVAARRRLMFSTLRMNKPPCTSAAIATSATAASDKAGGKKWKPLSSGEWTASAEVRRFNPHSTIRPSKDSTVHDVFDPPLDGGRSYIGEGLEADVPPLRCIVPLLHSP